MSIYSTQFFAGSLASGTEVLYTPPGTDILVVRDLELYGNYAASTQVSLAIGVSGSPRAYFFFQNPLDPGKWVQWQGRVVIEPGQQLLSVTGEAGATLIASGYLFSS